MKAEEQKDSLNLLPKLPKDPEPTEQDLQPHMQVMPLPPQHKDLARRFARLLWRRAEAQANPDLFLVPFTSWITSFPEGMPTYEAYRASPLWQNVRTQVFRRSSKRCECCGDTAVEVHHRDYRPRVLLGNDLGPLVAICRDCHEFVHKDPHTKNHRDCWQDQEATLSSIYQHGILEPLSA